MSADTPIIAGCIIEQLGTEDCERVVAWLLGQGGPAPSGLWPGIAWALAHSDDGVTWGRLDRDAGRWRLGNEVVPEVSPPIRPEALQELRVFGEQCEVLIWRSDRGLRGRVLRDSEPTVGRANASDPLRPSDESRILRGNYVRETTDRAFTWVADRTGGQQVLPLAVHNDQLQERQVRLHVRHYWSQDVGDGTVRVAATRLVKLTTEG